MNLIKYYHNIHEIPSQTYCTNYISKLMINKDDILFTCLSLSIDEFELMTVAYDKTIVDLLIIDISNRVKAILRSHDVLCHNDQNEFTIILTHLDDLTHLDKIINRIIAVFQSPFYIDQKSILFSTYIGLAHHPKHSQNIHDLIQFANIAMYFSKNTGKNTYTEFNSNMTKDIDIKEKLIKEIKLAIKENQFRVYYQPIIDTSTNTVAGAEALLRWQHPKRVVVLPNDYLLVAKETGLIVSIEKWILSEVFQQLHLWERQSSMRTAISINISKEFLSEIKFIDYLSGIASLYNIIPSLITFEISEDVLVDDNLKLKENLKALIEMKYAICLDNFNANFSSLKLLNNTLISRIKISKHFIDGIHTNNKDEAIIQMLTSLANALDLEVTALGVEDIHQINFLNNISCTRLQGYYYSSPLENSDFESFVSKFDIKR